MAYDRVCGGQQRSRIQITWIVADAGRTYSTVIAFGGHDHDPSSPLCKADKL